MAGQAWKAALGIGAHLLGTMAAVAADYPYSGRLTLTPAGVSVTRGQFYCAYNFFLQQKDGGFTGYHLDLARFGTDGTVRYVTYQSGRCTLDSSAPSVESCLMSFDTDPRMQGNTFIDAYRVLDGGVIGIFYFGPVDEARAFAASNNASRGPDAQFVPCDDPGGRSVDAYLTDEPSTLSPQDRASITSPNLDDATTGTMLRVLDAIVAGK